MVYTTGLNSVDKILFLSKILLDTVGVEKIEVEDDRGGTGVFLLKAHTTNPIKTPKHFGVQWSKA